MFLKALSGKINYCLIVFAGLFSCLEIRAQNVGIGTTTPQATLDVMGNHRVGGTARYITFDSTTGKIEWKNANLFVPVTQALMKHSAAADGLFYNNTAPVSGQLEYRNALGEPVFYTNFTNGHGYFKNYLGLGTVSPFTNLHIVSNNNFPVIVNGASDLYLSWAENSNYRGYLGSFAGNPEDVDFGTYSGNASGKIHFTIQANPKMTVGTSGNVGIGTTDPLARLHVADNSVVFSGTGFVSLPAADPPINGTGRRMMWYAEKAAFRSGYVNSTQWDNDSVGAYSFAAGFDVKARGLTSVAMGNTTSALAHYSTAFGINTIASGEYSTTMGFYSQASGIASTAIGNSSAKGLLSTSIGEGTIAKGYASTVIGMYNDSILTADQTSFTPATPLFIIGNGNFLTRSNVMTVLKSGKVGIGVNDPQQALQVNGNIRADSFKYSSPKTLYYSIPDAEFTSTNSGYTVFKSGGSFGAYILNAPGVGQLVAPIHLPHGAVLVSMTFDFYDASATQDIKGQLLLLNVGFVTPYSSVQSSGSGGASPQTINYNVPINNQSFAYFVSVSATTGAWNNDDIRIRRVMIQYTLNETQ